MRKFLLLFFKLFSFFLFITSLGFGFFLIWPFHIPHDAVNERVNPPPHYLELAKISKDSFVGVNGVKLHVIEAGPKDGKQIFFLHGFPDTALICWSHQILYFANKGYRVIAPDQRGYNTSEKPKEVKDYLLSNCAEDIYQLIKNYSRPEEKVYVVGHDFGGAVTWNLLGNDPDKKIEKAVIVNVPHPKGYFDSVMSNPFAQLLKSWYAFFFQVDYLAEYRVRKDSFSLPIKLLVESHRSKGLLSQFDLENYRKAWNQTNAVTSMLNWYRAVLRYKDKEPAHEITTPLMILWGELDQFLTVSSAEFSTRYCKDCHLKRVANASHWITKEEPLLVNQAIEQFLTASQTR